MLQILLYADDGVLVAESAQDLQHMLQALHEYCALWRLHVNVKKTKVVVFNPSGQCADELYFIYEGQRLERVQEFKYLGVVFHATRGLTAAI